MKIPCLTVVLALNLILLSGLRSEETNLLENGSFTDGKRYWNGDMNVEVEGENHFFSMEAKERKIQSFEQKIKTKDLKDVVLKFKFRTSDDYKGRGITLRFERQNGSTFMDVEMKPTKDWQEFVWKFGEVKNADSLKFSVEIKEGSGSIFLDDFSILPKND